MIVVGVDGSEGAASALEFAAAEAALRGATVRIVSAWDLPPTVYEAGLAPAPPLIPETMEALSERAQQLADEGLATVKKLQPSVSGEAVAVQGQAADALLAQAEEADLIVVGRRGLGGFKSLLLGSVSQQVVQHASCPVVVVR